MKHTILFSQLFCLFTSVILFFAPIAINPYNSTDILLFFYVGSAIVLGLSFVDIYQKRDSLLKGISFFNAFISILASLIVAIYFYNHKTPLGLSIVLLLLCLFYGIYKRTFYKPHIIMIIIFIFSTIKLLSILWSNNIKEGFDHIDYYCLFIFLPIMSCFDKVEKADLKLFIYTVFSIFLGLLILEFMSYIFLLKSLNQSFFAFLSFNKSYLGYMGDQGYLAKYYNIILWTKTSHPSKMAWICMVVGVAGYWLWQEGEKKIITTYQLLLYFATLLIFSFAVQARVTILGIFILISLFVWVSLMKRVKKPKLIALFTVIVFIIGSLITKEIITKTTFFNDEGRVKVNEAALVHFKEHPFIGGGAGYETQLIHSLNINLNSLHNEFLTALSDQGLLGLSFLLLFHVLVIYYGLKNKYFLGIYVLIAFSIFNATEGVMGLPICIPFFLFCLIPPKQT